MHTEFFRDTPWKVVTLKTKKDTEALYKDGLRGFEGGQWTTNIMPRVHSLMQQVLLPGDWCAHTSFYGLFLYLLQHEDS
jgi:hypothetical protein